jgi:hypothetical protein
MLSKADRGIKQSLNILCNISLQGLYDGGVGLLVDCLPRAISFTW